MTGKLESGKYVFCIESICLRLPGPLEIMLCCFFQKHGIGNSAACLKGKPAWMANSEYAGSSYDCPLLVEYFPCNEITEFNIFQTPLRLYVDKNCYGLLLCFISPMNLTKV